MKANIFSMVFFKPILSELNVQGYLHRIFINNYAKNSTLKKKKKTFKIQDRIIVLGISEGNYALWVFVPLGVRLMTG